MIKKIWKNVRASFARDTWCKKAIWLSSDFPDEVAWAGQKLNLRLFDICLPTGQFEFLLDGYSYLRELKKCGAFRLSIANNRVYADINEITVEITSAEEIFIVREIHLGKDYNFRTNEKTVVVDIGMNVGMASLYFASRDDVLHVYGYEPFTPTYLQNCRNLDNNPRLAAKITSHNFGLSDSEKVSEVAYDPDNKGQAGIHGTKLVRRTSKETRIEKIALKPVLPEIRKIIAKHPGFDLVCKIDCEGAEYEIFNQFSEQGIPEVVKVVMLEWHEKGPEPLLEILVRNGFRGVATSTYRQDVGMVYAFRSEP